MADVPVVKISVLEGVYAQLNRLGFALPVVMALSELRASPADAEWDIRRSKSGVTVSFSWCSSSLQANPVEGIDAAAGKTSPGSNTNYHVNKTIRRRRRRRRRRRFRRSPVITVEKCVMTETDCAADSFAAAGEDVSTSVTPQGGEGVSLGVRVAESSQSVNSEPVDDSPGSDELYNLLKPTGMLQQQGLVVEEVSLTPSGSVRLECSPVKYAGKEGFPSEIEGYQAKRGNRVRYDGKETQYLFYTPVCSRTRSKLRTASPSAVT